MNSHFLIEMVHHYNLLHILDAPDVLTNLLGSWYKYDTEEEEEDDDLELIDDKNSIFAVECAYLDACAAGVAKNRENLRTLSLVLR